MIDQTGLDLLQHLMGRKDKTVSTVRLGIQLKRSKPTMVRQIRKLEEAGLIRVYREKRGQPYSFEVLIDSLSKLER